MNTSVDIGIVVLIAATMVVISFVTCVLARRSAIVDDKLARGATWLIVANLTFLGAAAAVSLINVVPLQVSTSIGMSGVLLGVLFGYFAMSAGLGAPPYTRVFSGIVAASILLQFVISLNTETMVLLMATNSAINGLLTLTMGGVVLRAARSYPREFRVLVGAPFFVLSAGYTLRLSMITFGASVTPIVTATALLTFLLAFSSLQWSFSLIAIRASRLNTSLEAERKTAQDLAQSRSRFLAHMSHEIRTPLNSVLGLADVLQTTLKDSEARETVRHIQTSGDLLIHILNDILDVSKLEASAVKLEHLPVDITALLAEIEASHAPACRDAGLAFEIEIAPEVAGHWLGDPHRIKQILHNIIGNAVKFTESGHVRVAASGSEQLQLTIEDSGIGMTQSQIATLFDEFFQADEGITRRFGGTGLGMAIVKRLVTLMGGTVEVSSQPGHGTRFSLTLPLERATGPAIATPAQDPAATEADFTGLRVLCADDSAGNLLVLGKMLRLMGMEPETVKDGHAAIAAAQDQRFDIYLLDISMPGFSGIETLHGLRQIEQDQQLPAGFAVAATANVLPLDVERYLALGFDTHLPKPIRLEALKEVLQASQSGSNDQRAVAE
ncbi:ATP-binding protein [Pararhodobacter oceanensis]|uniref:ATP-binding protein n=1 Tax=Pararhodobacter oceanensis TaxID=2172121 RepID=UPI003A91C25A